MKTFEMIVQCHVGQGNGWVMMTECHGTDAGDLVMILDCHGETDVDLVMKEGLINIADWVMIVGIHF